MQALVTGGAGFIGSHLAAALQEQGVAVRVLDNFSSGRRENLAGLSVDVMEGDVADMAVVATAVADCDLIFHLASLVSVLRSIHEPELNHRSNVTGTFNLFEAARQAGIRRVVYASSAAVYGNLPGLPKRESDRLQLLTPYAAAKRTAELMAESYNASFQTEFVGLRFMNVFGPRQDALSPYSGVLSLFCHAVLKGEGVTIFGDGEQTRDFVYVDDVVKATLLAARVPASQLSPTPVFNVGRGQQTSLNQIVAMLSTIRKRPIPITYQPERAGDIKHSLADISLAQDKLGYWPETAVSAGLQKTLDWLRHDQDFVQPH